MNHKAIDKNVAKKYAKAFIAVFPQSISLSDINKIEAAQAFLQTHKRTLFLLQLPQLNQQTKESMIADLVGHFLLPEHFCPLIMLLIKHNRSFYIPDVLWCVAQLYKEKTNSVDFSIISTHNIDEEQIASIKHFLKKQIDKNIIRTVKHDASLIAGLRLKSDNLLWEYSVHKQIKALRALKK